jgi:hypothetical protein
VSTDRERALVELHAHLAATAERPVETAAGRWLGEAEAVAADALRGDPPEAVVRERVRQVSDLLANVDGTGDPEADDHVASARDRAEAVLASFEDRQ